MLSFLSQPLRFGRRPMTPRRRFGLQPQLEMLEGREVPAGLLTATFASGILKISGDTASNTLTIHQNADGRLTLTTDIGTGLKVNGNAVSGFMGHTLSAPVSGGVFINMGDGSDSLTFSGLNADIDLPSTLSINGGAGNNLVRFDQGVTVSGNATISNGLGLDTLHFYDEVTFLGKLTINNGNGGSLLDGNTSTVLYVANVLGLTNGTGKDEIDLAMAQKVTLGGLALKNGSDTDGSDTDLSPVQSLTINGNMTITNGAGNDDVDIGDLTQFTKITGAVTIANGAGSNHTDFVGTESLEVIGAVHITGGAGVDYAHFGMMSKAVSFGSNITINLGSGFNGIGMYAQEALSVKGNITITGGADADDIDLFTTQDGMVGGAVKVSLGTGQNTFEARAENGQTLTFGKTLTYLSSSTIGQGNFVELHSVKVNGVSTITTGAGNDFITIDDGTFNGKFNLNTNAGSDQVFIEQNTSWTGHTQFNQAVSIKTGANDDSVKIASILAEPERKTIFAASVLLDGGLGTDTLQLSEFGANQFYGPAASKIGF
jgi:hypothetical protein